VVQVSRVITLKFFVNIKTFSSLVKSSKRLNGITRSFVETLKGFSPELEKSSCPIQGKLDFRFTHHAVRNSIFRMLPSSSKFFFDFKIREGKMNTTVSGIVFFDIGADV
jgi:hypothetical protein